MRNPKISKTTTTAEIVGSIDDLLVHIFVHLPLKPLIHFKLVSKHWKSIISDPRFHLLRSQLAPNNNRAVGLFVLYHRWNKQPKETRFISFSSNPQNIQRNKKIPDTLEIFHSCNGLFVLRSATRKEFYVYNPTTNKKRRLQDKKGGWAPDCVLGMNMAFDPSKSPHYKVVCVWKLSRTGRHVGQVQFDVYSSETGSWETRSRSITADVVDNGFYEGVFWNGAMHWFNSTVDSICLSVDDQEELPRVLPKHPTHHKENARGYYYGYYFGESCGHLHCAGLAGDHDDLPCWVYVYEMRSDYSEWFIKYKVEENTQYLRNIYKVRFLHSVVRGNKDEDSFLVLGNTEGEMKRYNLANNTFQTIQLKEQKTKINSMVLLASFQYIESLCPV